MLKKLRYRRNVIPRQQHLKKPRSVKRRILRPTAAVALRKKKRRDPTAEPEEEKREVEKMAAEPTGCISG